MIPTSHHLSVIIKQRILSGPDEALLTAWIRQLFLIFGRLRALKQQVIVFPKHLDLAIFGKEVRIGLSNHLFLSHLKQRKERGVSLQIQRCCRSLTKIGSDKLF